MPVIDRRLVVEAGAGPARTLLAARSASCAERAYDVAIDLQGLLKSALLARGCRARRG